MKTFPLSLILLILLARSAFPQDNTAAGQVTPVILRDSTPVSQRALWIWLAGQFKAADTVLLVSHRATGDAIDPLTKRRNLAPLTIAGQPNDSLITEKYIISGAMLDSLVMIFTSIIEFDRPNPGLCFFPQQAILLLKNGQASWIDLCFHCENFAVSPDLQLFNQLPFGYWKWAELKTFFIRRGLHYNMK